MKLLITGGAGFMGSNFVKHILEKYPDYEVVNLDKLTYAGNLENLKDIENDPRYQFIKGDICDSNVVRQAAEGADAIINFAAETHVDRSIMEPGDFIKTDVFGAYILLEATRELGIKKYIQISTDEVYGDLERGCFAKESDNLKPSSPYSASKAGGDLQVLAFRRTYNLPVMITRSTNNYGPNQYPEKIIPLFVTNLLEDKKVPVYGDGGQVRDWIYVDDHSRAVDIVLHKGEQGEIYNVGANNDPEITNLGLTKKIISELGIGEDMIEYVKDRAGHDRRYAVDCSKLKSLGWRTEVNFEEGIKKTIDWYKNNAEWWKKIKSGGYLEYYRKQYQER